MTTIVNAPKIFCKHNEYRKIKKNLKKTTTSYGIAISTAYLLTMGAEQGISAALGSVTSLAYLKSLENYVDTIEKAPFQKQLLIPIGTAIFETMFNEAPFAFDFDYSATFVGFLSYKLALCNVLYDYVREWLLTPPSELEQSKVSETSEMEPDHK